MAYSIRIQPPIGQCPHCGRPYCEPDCPDPTYNMAPLFDAALTDESWPSPTVTELERVVLRVPVDRPRGLCLLSGRKCRDTVEQIASAIARLADPARESEWKALESRYCLTFERGLFGSAEGAIEVLGLLLVCAEQCPDGTWEVR